MAVAKWNTLTENCLNQRKHLSQFQKDYLNPLVAKKIWKAARALRDFIPSRVVRITGLSAITVEKYLNLLEENGYIRISSTQNDSETEINYHCIKQREIKAPSWLTLQLTPRDYEIYRQEKKALKWKKITAKST